MMLLKKIITNLIFFIIFLFIENIYAATYVTVTAGELTDINTFRIGNTCNTPNLPTPSSLPSINDDVILCAPTNVADTFTFEIVSNLNTKYRNLTINGTVTDGFVILNILQSFFVVDNLSITAANMVHITTRSSNFTILKSLSLTDTSNMDIENPDFTHSRRVALFITQNSKLIVGSNNFNSTITLSNSTLAIDGTSAADLGLTGEISIIGRNDSIFNFNNRTDYIKIGNPTTGRGSFILEDAALLPVYSANGVFFFTEPAANGGYRGVHYLIVYANIFDLRPRTTGMLPNAPATGGIFQFQSFEIKFEGPANSPPTEINLSFSNLYTQEVNANDATDNTTFKSIIVNRPNLKLNLISVATLTDTNAPNVASNAVRTENITIIQGTVNVEAGVLAISKTYNGDELRPTDPTKNLFTNEGLFMSGGSLIAGVSQQIVLRSDLNVTGGILKSDNIFRLLQDAQNRNININGNFTFNTLIIRNPNPRPGETHRTITFEPNTSIRTTNSFEATGTSTNNRIRLIGKDSNNPWKLITGTRTINNVAVQNATAEESSGAILPLITANIGDLEISASNNINLGNNIAWFQEALTIIKAVAKDSKDTPDPGISVGDTITLTFNQITNMSNGGVLSKSNVDDLFTFSGNLGINYNATWQDPRNIVLSILDPTNTNAIIIDDPALTLKVQIKPTSTITGNWAGAIPKSTSNRNVTGDFGDLKILSFVANDPENISIQYTKGDAFIINFNYNTNQPFGPKMHKENVDKIFKFSHPLGDDYEGEWTDPKTFTITMLETRGGNAKIGLSTAVVKSTAKLSSQTDRNLINIFTPTSPVLSGDFGKFLTNNLDSVKITPTLVRPSITPLIIFRDLPPDTTIQIFDISEQLLFQARTTDTTASYNLSTVSGNSLGSGIYLVLLKSSTHTRIMKFAVVR